MYFQTLDDKTECVGIYASGQLFFDAEDFPTDLSRTWKYAPYLRNENIDYAILYLEGSPLVDHIPEYLKEDWEDVCQQLRAFQRSLNIAQINSEETCFFDLVPRRFLVDFCEVKNSITEHIFTTLKRPDRYDFYKHIAALLGDIRAQRVTLDKRLLSSYRSHPKLGNQVKTLLERPPYVHYNQFGTKTGRLTTANSGLPMLTLPQVLKKAVKPQHDYFVELDFNGAEVRTLLGLLGKEQPHQDVHTFHLAHIFKDLRTRAAAKVAFFAWLYGSKTAANSPESYELGLFYDKEKILDTYWDGTTVITPFKKRMENVSRHHALNYLVQSTTAELVLKQALKINFLLRQRGAQSRVAFLIHDAIVLDMRNDEAHHLADAVQLMRSTNFGNFKINMTKGATLGSMEDIGHG